MLREVYLVLDLCRRACEETLDRNPDFHSTVLAMEDASSQLKPKVFYAYDITTARVPYSAQNTRLVKINQIWHKLLCQHEDFGTYKRLMLDIHTHHYVYFSVTALWVAIPWSHSGGGALQVHGQQKTA